MPHETVDLSSHHEPEKIVRNCATCRYMEMTRPQGQIQQQMICRFLPPAMLAVQTPNGVQATPIPVFVQDGVWCWQYEVRLT